MEIVKPSSHTCMDITKAIAKVNFYFREMMVHLEKTLFMTEYTNEKFQSNSKRLH